MGIPAGTDAQLSDVQQKHSIPMCFRINIVKLMNFPPLRVKHTVFPLRTGCKIGKK